MKRRGDTLIEVALAIGIFSMIAIVIVSVTSASTSGAQSSLELTLTREELDAQAEALRFIHDSYVSGSQAGRDNNEIQNNSENPYAKLWEAITGRAASAEADVTYTPTTCNSIYDAGGKLNPAAGSKPFILNLRNLSNPTSVADVLITTGDDDVSDTTKNIFYQTDTYPRTLYGTDGDGSLLAQSQNTASNLNRAEGIFIVVAKSESVSVTNSNGAVANQSAAYDFYIRSCWMPVGSDRAATISTVVRLYDPAVITY